MHERQLLREAVIAALLNQTSAGSRVTKSRLAPAQIAELPTISVYTDTETASVDIEAPRELLRKPSVSIDAWLMIPPSGNLDDAFDAIALEIETAMDTDWTLGGTAGDSFLSSTEFGMKLDGERTMGCLHLEYTVEYRTAQRTVAAEAALPNFNTIDVKMPKVDGKTTTDTATEVHDFKTNIHE